MKKISVLIAFFALSFSFATAQTGDKKSNVTIAYGLDSLQNPLYGDIFLFGKQTPFYIIIDDATPVQCNKLKVSAYYKDYTNGKAENEYWVYQGAFDFPITPNYYGYWMQMNAYLTGEYKVEVSGYLNGTYRKSFGTSTFTVYSEDDFWDWGIW